MAILFEIIEYLAIKVLTIFFEEKIIIITLNVYNKWTFIEYARSRSICKKIREGWPIADKGSFLVPAHHKVYRELRRPFRTLAFSYVLIARSDEMDLTRFSFLVYVLSRSTDFRSLKTSRCIEIFEPYRRHDHVYLTQSFQPFGWSYLLRSWTRSPCPSRDVLHWVRLSKLLVLYITLVLLIPINRIKVCYSWQKVHLICVTKLNWISNISICCLLTFILNSRLKIHI